MRRAFFSLSLLFVGLPAFAQPPQPPKSSWPVSAAISHGRLDVSWDRCPDGAREWEVFLSLDGGKTYPLRVTPHLGTDVRSFSWSIPRILADAGKLRVRFGDGRTEDEYDVDGDFPLQPALKARPLTPASRDLGQRPSTGEEQTAAWVEWNGGVPRTVAPIAPLGVASSSEWRSGASAVCALPARKLAPARPFPAKTSPPLSLDREPFHAAEPGGPSLAVLSRLNL